MGRENGGRRGRGGGHFFTQMNTVPSKIKKPKKETSDGIECRRGGSVEWASATRIYSLMKTQLSCPSLIHGKCEILWILIKVNKT